MASRLTELTIELESTDLVRRRTASTELLKIAKTDHGLSAAFPALRGALDDEDPDVRTDAALALLTTWLYRSPLALATLAARRLADSRPLSTTALASLIAAVRSSDRVQRATALVPVVNEAARSADPETRRNAFLASRCIA